jgi:hypothetical protein
MKLRNQYRPHPPALEALLHGGGWPEEATLRCPFCGGLDVAMNLHEWPTFSADDPDNRCVLAEHQCRSETCNRSFWT